MEPAVSLIDVAERAFREFGDRPLFGTKVAGAWAWSTYRQLELDVAALRAGLARLGVRPADRVAIVANNRLEWAAVTYATFGLGAVLVPIWANASVEAWRLAIADSGATTVIATGVAAAELERIDPRSLGVAHVLSLDRASGPGSYASVVDLGRDAPVDPIRPASDALAVIAYTGGVKGVELTHGNLVASVSALHECFPLSSSDRWLSSLPWAHVTGQVLELHAAVSCGGSVAVGSGPAHLLEELGQVQPTVLVGVPGVFSKLYAEVQSRLAAVRGVRRSLFSAGIRYGTQRLYGKKLGPLQALELALAHRLVFSEVRTRFGALRFALTTGGALDPGVADVAEALGLRIYEGYDLTEATSIVAVNRPGARKRRTSGRPLPGVRVRISGQDDGHAPGEILVAGPTVSRGYHHRPLDDEQVFLPDGWLRTGDLGFIDDGGFLHVLGRIRDEFALSGGARVMPSKVEDALRLSPYIADALVYGGGKPFPVALVVLEENAVRTWAREVGTTLTEDLTGDATVHELVQRELDWYGGRLRPHEKPRHFMLVAQRFTARSGMLGPTGRLRRNEALARYRADLERLYLDRGMAAATAA